MSKRRKRGKHARNQTCDHVPCTCCRSVSRRRPISSQLLVGVDAVSAPGARSVRSSTLTPVLQSPGDEQRPHRGFDTDTVGTPALVETQEMFHPLAYQLHLPSRPIPTEDVHQRPVGRRRRELGSQEPHSVTPLLPATPAVPFSVWQAWGAQPAEHIEGLCTRSFQRAGGRREAQYHGPGAQLVVCQLFAHMIVGDHDRPHPPGVVPPGGPGDPYEGLWCLDTMVSRMGWDQHRYLLERVGRNSSPTRPLEVPCWSCV